MRSLINGFIRFKRNIFPQERQFYHELARGQYPQALFITCADSRVVPELITQARPGDLFVCRTIGNQVPVYGSEDGSAVASAVEYALQVLNIRDIVVCGHSDCGAMKALLDPEKLEGLPATARWLRDAVRARALALTRRHLPADQSSLEPLAQENVLLQVENLKTYPGIEERLSRGELKLHGWLYYIDSGEILNFDARQAAFVPLDERANGPTTPMHELPLGGAA
jgi:carbonic anhydrase